MLDFGRLYNSRSYPFVFQEPREDMWYMFGCGSRQAFQE